MDAPFRAKPRFSLNSFLLLCFRFVLVLGVLALMGWGLNRFGLWPDGGTKNGGTKKNGTSVQQASKTGQASKAASKAKPGSAREKLDALEQELLHADSKRLLAIAEEREKRGKAALANPDTLSPEALKELEALQKEVQKTGTVASGGKEAASTKLVHKGFAGQAKKTEKAGTWRKTSKLTRDVDLPPFVPMSLLKKENPQRTAAAGYINPARGLSRAEQPLFKDLDGLNLQQPWNQRLVEAVRFAQEQRKRLLPLQEHSRLDWQRPVTRRELAVWLSQFALLPQVLPPDGKSPFEDVELNSPTFSAIYGVVNKRWMWPVPKVPETEKSQQDAETKVVVQGLTEEKTTFDPNGLYRRQELCKTYLNLSGQEPYLLQALRDGREDWRDWIPPNADAFAYPTRLSDWQQIAPGYRGGVAFCYRDGLLEEVFTFTPAALEQGQPWHPNQAVTRGEALVFLHSLWQRGYLR